MGDYGYDFKYKQWVFKKGQDYQSIRRQIYMRFRCENKSHIRRSSKE